MEFLQRLFGTKDGQPEALTYEQLMGKISTAKLNIVDLSAGEYVAKAKFDAKVEELKGVTQQLTDANGTIKSYKDMDIEGVKKSAADWQAKYEKETKELKDRMTQQERDFEMDRFLDAQGFSSPLARAGARAEFQQKAFALKDGEFQGAKEWITGLKTSDPTSFKTETPAPGADGKPGATGDEPPAPGTAVGGQPSGTQLGQQPPAFVAPTGAPAAGNTPGFAFHFTGVRKPPENK